MNRLKNRFRGLGVSAFIRLILCRCDGLLRTNKWKSMVWRFAGICSPRCIGSRRLKADARLIRFYFRGCHSGLHPFDGNGRSYPIQDAVSGGRFIRLHGRILRGLHPVIGKRFGRCWRPPWQMRGGIFKFFIQGDQGVLRLVNRLTVPATHPALRNAQLIGYDPEGRFAIGATGDKTRGRRHGARIVGRTPCTAFTGAFSDGAPACQQHPAVLHIGDR